MSDTQRKIMDLQEALAKYFYQMMIIIVGIGASFVRVTMQKKKRFKDFFMSFVGGICSSVFFCWVAYEICFYFTQTEQFSLAIGGFCAWQGGEWIKSIIDDFIKHRIIQRNDNNKWDDFKDNSKGRSDEL